MTAEATSATPARSTPSFGRVLLNKVPQITFYFWIIKVLCTTVGETFADYLNVNLGFGLNGTTYAMGAALAVALFFQFRLTRYVPFVYWLAVVLISIFGTLITDNMVENLGISLPTSTILFSIALALTFAVWFAFERTLSIHTIVTRRRESSYWLAVLFTFALGTAGGDLVSEQFGLGYPVAVLIFAASIGLVVVARVGMGINAVLAFWLAYILTRPLGASIGDLMSQAKADGGLGLGTTVTSLIFLGLILALVVYLQRSKVDLEEVDETEAVPAETGAIPEAA